MHLAMHPIAEASVFGSHVPEGLMIECRSDIHADRQFIEGEPQSQIQMQRWRWDG